MAILPPHASGALFLWQVPAGQLIPETWMCDDQISQKLPEAGAHWTGPSAVALPICSGLICMESKPGLAFPPLHQVKFTCQGRLADFAIGIPSPYVSRIR